MSSIRFLGAAGTVTGSRYLVQTTGGLVLVDAGLFQGMKELRLRNWAPFPVALPSLAASALTHAHIAPAGGLPLLWREGFRGPVYCTPATRDLAHLLLPDSGRLQEEEARYANKRGYSKHAPRARPLYDEEEAVRSLRLLPRLPPAAWRAPQPRGLLPRRAPPLPAPGPGAAADDVLGECTYGDRAHVASPVDELRVAVVEAHGRGGPLIMPAFAVGRTQEILFHLRALEAARAIPELPVFVDSPMACDATPIYLAHREDHDHEMVALFRAGVEPLRPARPTLPPAPPH